MVGQIPKLEFATHPLRRTRPLLVVACGHISEHPIDNGWMLFLHEFRVFGNCVALELATWVYHCLYRRPHLLFVEPSSVAGIDIGIDNIMSMVAGHYFSDSEQLQCFISH